MTPYFASTPDRHAAVRLFCFHHAGGAASTFADWQAFLGSSVSVVPIQLPGRENRTREPRLTDMTRLIDVLTQNLGPWLDEPYAFYGHSMGAFIAHALTRRRMATGGRLPDRLMIGAARAPHLPIVLSDAIRLSDEELGRMLVGFGGMSSTLLRYPEWLAAATAMVRDDLAICETNPYRDTVGVPCPMDLFAGSADTMVLVDQVGEWQRHAGGPSDLHVLPGGHFFVKEQSTALLRKVSAMLTRVPARF